MLMPDELYRRVCLPAHRVRLRMGLQKTGRSQSVRTTISNAGPNTGENQKNGPGAKCRAQMVKTIAYMSFLPISTIIL